MKMRKGWKIIWEDGTEWIGDCARWAAAPLTPGARLESIRILGGAKWPCPGCLHGTRH